MPRSYGIFVPVRAAIKSCIAEPVCRFVLSSYPAFASLDMDIEEHRHDEQRYKAAILAYSRKLRFFLGVLADDISGAAERSLDSGTLTNQQELELSSYFDTIKDMEKLWHICEIFHLNSSSDYLSIEAAKWFLSSSRLLPSDDLLSHLRTASLRGEQRPEQGALPGGADFWTCASQLAVRGLLPQLSSLIQCHSAIRKATDNKRSKESHTVEQLHELLLSHPYAHTVHNDGEEAEEVLMAADKGRIAVDFKMWQERVWRMRQEASALLAAVPELDSVLQILLGDARSINAACGDEWTERALATLLFVYPPPLTRANICRILDDAIAAEDIGAAREMALKRTIRGVATGDLGGVLRRLFESGSSPGADATSQRLLHLVGLLTTGHLAHLLVYGADMTELLVMLPAASLECSFPEEVFIEASQLLHELRYPLDLVVGYLQVCPNKGVLVAQQLLARSPCGSDEEAVAMAAALRSLGLEEQARSVEVARAMRLLQQPRSAGGDEGAVVPRALALLRSAGDVNRLVALLDRVAFRLFHAVYSSEACFVGLCAPPPVPAGPLSNHAASGGDGSRGFVEMSDWSVTDAAASSSSSWGQPEERLLAQMQELAEATAAVSSSGDDAASLLALQLQNYLSAVQLRLDMREGDGGDCLREAGLRVHGVLASGALPARYTLHLLDLAVWFDDTHDVYTTRLRRNCEVAQRSTCSIFSKAEAYDLLSRLQAALLHYAPGALRGSMSDVDVQALRLKAQSLWASTVAQENAVQGLLRREAEEKQRSGPISHAARQAYHDKYHVYEMLTGNTLIRYK